MTKLADLGLDPQAMLKALYEARATGTSEVAYSDGNQSRTVRYKSDADLAAAIAAVEADIAAAAAGMPSVNLTYVRSEKGFL